MLTCRRPHTNIGPAADAETRLYCGAVTAHLFISNSHDEMARCAETARPPCPAEHGK
jgi:hypothetical protein